MIEDKPLPQPEQVKPLKPDVKPATPDVSAQKQAVRNTMLAAGQGGLKYIDDLNDTSDVVLDQETQEIKALLEPWKHEGEVSSAPVQSEQKASISEKARAKAQGAAVLVGVQDLPQDTLAAQIDKKIGQFQQIIDNKEVQIFDGGSLGEIIIDQSDRLASLSFKREEARRKVLTDYATTAAAVSARYTSSSDVGLLPPEAYRVNELTELQHRIDENGIVLTTVGVKQKVFTRFYRIPAQQLDKQKKPIPLAEQRILVVQDLPLNNGNTRRIYAVSTATAIDDDLENFQAQQNVSGQVEEGQQVSASGVPDQHTQEKPEDQPDQTTQPSTETPLTADAVVKLNTLTRLVDAITAGTATSNSLQKYAEYAIQNGVPRNQVEMVLESKGIKVQRKKETGSIGSEQATKTNETAGNDDLLEKVKNADNQFDDEAASRIVAVTRDWVKFGGNFYYHLTGKDPQLQRGVDYQALPDGKPDMKSYKAAQHQKTETWLQKPGNHKWLRDAEQFSQNHAQEIGGMETVHIKQADGTVVDKQRYSTPYLYDQGWLYYESNYFNKQTGQMTQPNRESTKYRVYFSPDGGDVIGTFQDVITQLNTDPEVRKQGFQIKTADANKLGEGEISQIMNQRDRVVLYLGEEGMQAALPILQKYAEANPQRFSQEGVLLGQPLIDSQGKEIPGVVVTSEPRGKSPDPAAPGEYKSFSEVQGRIIESSFRTIVTGLRDPNNAAQLRAKYPDIYKGLSVLGEKAAIVEYMKVILADPNGADLLKRNLQNTYPQWAKAYGISTQNIAFKST